MSACAVLGCKNHSRTTKGMNVHYFRFPKDENLAKKWIQLCKRSDKINLKTARVCSDHFTEECYFISLKQRLMKYSNRHQRTLKADAIPMVNIPLLVNCNKEKSEERSERILKRCRRMIVTDLLANEAKILKKKENPMKQVEPLEKQDMHRKQCSILVTETEALPMELSMRNEALPIVVKILKEQENPKKQVEPHEGKQDELGKQCSILTAQKEVLPVELSMRKKALPIIIKILRNQVEPIEEEQDKCRKQCSILTAEKEALPMELSQSENSDCQPQVDNPEKQVVQSKEEQDKCGKQCSLLAPERKDLPMEVSRSQQNEYQIQVDHLEEQVKQLEEERDKWSKQCCVLTAVKKALSMELVQKKKNDYHIQVEELEKQVKRLEQERNKWRKHCVCLTAEKKALSVELAQSKKSLDKCINIFIKSEKILKKRKLAQEKALRHEEVINETNNVLDSSHQV